MGWGAPAHLFSRYSKKYRVAATSNLEEFVSSYASINRKSKALTVFLVNRSVDQEREVTVDINDFPVHGFYKTLTLSNLPGDETFVSHTENALVEGRIEAASDSFTTTLPPMSVTAVLLKKRSVNGDGHHRHRRFAKSI